MKEYYIWLTEVMGVANPRSIRLLRHFGGAKKVYETLTNGETGFLKPHEARGLQKASLDKCAETAARCEENGFGIVTFDDADYPKLLKHIYDPPILLFTEGDIQAAAGEDDIVINIIGTREPSEYSYRVASVVSAELAKAGVVTVSGLAVGIDKCAMTAALDNGGKVAGVLACGIDVEYPRGSLPFRKRIAENGGVCFSEYMPGTKTLPAYFQGRNRLMSGIASGTLIVEAGVRSGCHITAAHAIAQNRDLFCVPPHDIFDPRYGGVVGYLRDGAVPVFSHLDVLNAYVPIIQNELMEAVPASLTPREAKSALKPVKNESAVNTKKPFPQPEPSPDYSNLGEFPLKIIETLKGGALTFDEIADVCGDFDTNGEFREILLDMELDGIIERSVGDKYAIK